MLRLPDESILRTWSDQADAPRVLVRCPEHLAVEASQGWPAWIGLADCDSFFAHGEAIRSWSPDLLVTVADPVRDSGYSSRCSSLQHTVGLDFGVFDDTAKPLLSRLLRRYPIEPTAANARLIRESCATLIGGFFRPGLMCVDYADIRALVAGDFVECAVVSVRLTHGTAAATLANLAARIERSRFHPQAVYSAIKTSSSFSMQDHDDITATIKLAFPGLPTIGPAVPLNGDGELSRVKWATLMIAGMRTPTFP